MFAIAAAGGVVAASVFFLWFRTGYFYAEGDVAPFVRDGLRSEFGWQWTHQASGAGGPTYELVRAPELGFIGLARLLGGTETLGQRLFFTAIFAFGACGVAAFVARFCRRAWLVLLAGIAGVCNPFVMIGLANALAGPRDRPRRLPGRGRGAQRRRRAVAMAADRVPLRALAYMVINPPFFALIVTWAVALVVIAPLLTRTGRAGVGRVTRLYGRAAALALPLSVWWIVPAWFAFTRSSTAGTMLAETNVQAWSWTQANASPGAVASLVGRWSWPDPGYHSATWLAHAPGPGRSGCCRWPCSWRRSWRGRASGERRGCCSAGAACWCSWARALHPPFARSEPVALRPRPRVLPAPRTGQQGRCPARPARAGRLGAHPRRAVGAVRVADGPGPWSALGRSGSRGSSSSSVRRWRRFPW